MKRRNPYTIPILLVALGAGLVIYHGEILYRFEPLSEQEVEARVDQQMQQFEDTRGPHLPPVTGDRRDALEARIRAEVVGQHEYQKNRSERWFFGGAAALIIAFGNLVMLRMMRAS